MGFIRDIYQNSQDSHQTSPGYVITILRWSNRDTFNYQGFNAIDVRKPLVITNDAINVQVSNTKSGLVPTMSATLKGGDLNYTTAVHPGDFVLVNMVNWEKDVERIRDEAINLNPINKYGDGFKGVFKVQSVRKKLQVIPSGHKILTYQLHAAGFTEFNNVIYFNPAIASAFKEQGTLLYSTLVGDYYQNILKSEAEVQVIMKNLFEILIGKSRRSNNVKVTNFGNVQFKLPNSLGLLLGRKMEYASDLFNYYIGGWGSNSGFNINSNNIGPLFNPAMSQDGKPGMYKAKYPLQGNKVVYIENWNNQTAWSILQSNMNKTMNEMFTTYRIDPDNNVMPSVIVRQKPFTTPHFVPPASFNVTKYFDLPRWRISPTLLLDYDLGLDESARMNFVQVFTRTLPGTYEQDMAQQIVLKNFVYDDGDISRNGLRPYVVTANFDFPTDKHKKLRAKEWTEIVSDWVIDGHLKESGSIRAVGIQDPISVGDNFEFNGVVYHIESTQHTITIDSKGNKKFRTNLTVSYGMDIRSSKTRPYYADMDNTYIDNELKEDFKNNRILPGISDTQNIKGRGTNGNKQGEKTKPQIDSSFTLSPKDKTTSDTNSLPNGNVKVPAKDNGEK